MSLPNIRIVDHAEVDPNSLIPHEVNWREHPESQKQVFDGVLKEVGFAQSVTVSKRTGKILDGHMRVQMAVEQGWPAIPVEYVDVDEREEAAIIATMNPMAALAERNRERIEAAAAIANLNDQRVKGLVAALQSRAPGVQNRQEILDGFQGEREEKQGKVSAEYPVNAGEQWQVGDCTVLCMDSTDNYTWGVAGSVARPALIVTSPPYFINREYESEVNEEEIKVHIEAVASGMSDIDPDRIVINVGFTPFSHVEGHRDVHFNLDWWQAAFRPKSWVARYVRTWIKTGPVYASPQSDLCDMNWEMICTFYNFNKPHTHAQRVSEPWATKGYWDDIGKPSHDFHSAPFPVELPLRYVLLYSVPGDTILDPYGGSGTTALAACDAGRKCILMEKHPAHCSITLSRLKAAWDIEPVLVETHETNTD